MKYLIFAGFPAYLIACHSFTLYDNNLTSIFLISLLVQILCIALVWSLDQVDMFSVSWRQDFWFGGMVIVIAATLPGAAAWISLQHPGLFNPRILLMDETQVQIFGIALVFSVTGMFIAGRYIKTNQLTDRLRENRLLKNVRRHRAGILTAIFCLGTYFIIAQSINFPGHYTRDLYFEADISDWINNFTKTPRADMKSIRAVHPAVMIFLKPSILLLSLFLHGDQLQASYLLNALAGAAGVFMIWLIIKQRTGSTTYASLSASLLGASAAHLLFASILETYIYSSLALIGVCLLVQREKTSLRSMIPIGVLTFGITITNLAQVCILYFLKSPRLKIMLQFISAVVLITFALNFIQTRWYANAELLTPANLTSEQKYSTKISATSWETKGRIDLVARAVLLYGVLAPQPYVLTEELGTVVPNFRTFKVGWKEIHVAGYKGLADIAVKFWIVILVLAILRFMLDLFKAPREMTFPLSLVLCLGFNFVLHVLYGDDPMLYSPNWTYALVLFTSVSLEKWAEKRWLQVILLLLLVAMIFTNMGLIEQILSVSAPFYSK